MLDLSTARARLDPVEPLALTVKGRNPEQIVAYACGLCGSVARSEQEARECLYCLCSRCRAPLDRKKDTGCICSECYRKMWAESEAREAEKEAARYEKAHKSLLSEYAGACFYSPEADGGGGGEGYFYDVGEFLDHFADDGKEPPTYVWACLPVKMAFDADDLIYSACEEMYEDAADDVPDSARKSLQAALDTWVERHSPTSYFPDYSRALEVDPDLLDREEDQ